MTRPTRVSQWFCRCLSGRGQFNGTPGSTSQRAVPSHVGELGLAEFQRRAVSRGLDIVQMYGGVILADAVGLGKTRVSLALADALMPTDSGRGDTPATLAVCIPARLRTQWSAALTAAGMAAAQIVTHTQLSRADRRELPVSTPSVVVVDEAHRFRNPRAKRTRRLARLIAGTPVVLATATPVCNTAWDLYHLLELFLSEHDLRGVIGGTLREAFEWAEHGDFDLTEVIEYVVIRRKLAQPTAAVGPHSHGRQSFGRRPTVSTRVLAYRADADERWLWEHLEETLQGLAFDLFRHDWPRPLFIQYVLKRWESGAPTLVETLETMAAFHRRWLEADAHGLSLTRQSFRDVFGGPAGRVQQVFPFLFDQPGLAEDIHRHRVVDDLAVFVELGRRARRVSRAGDARELAIVDFVRGTAQKVLVFTGYRRAAGRLYERCVEALGRRATIGLVTGAGARATGLGRTEIDDVVARFAPLSNGGRQLSDHQAIDVLVSTDCLSEGVNLQDCGHLVLADLPYSALTVEQRVGRLVRPGGPHDQVVVYLPRPTSWTDRLGLRGRLDRKMSAAADAGAAFSAAGQLQDSAVQRHSAGQRCSAGERRALANPSDGPLAAMTRLDGLAARLTSAGAPTVEPGVWRAPTAWGARRLWARVVVRDGARTRRLWWLVGDDASVEVRLHKVLPALLRDVESTKRLVRSQAAGELVDAAKNAAARRQRLLRARRLAPLPVARDAPQRQIWSQLHRAIDDGRLEVSDADIAECRQELLRSFPRGVEQRLSELADRQLPAAQRWRRVGELLGALSGELPRWQPDVCVDVVAALMLVPGST